MVHASLHGPSTSGRPATSPRPSACPPAKNFADDFHLYAVEWEPGTVRFYVDSNLYATFTQSQWPAGGTWVFDHPFFIILNLAVGGGWPGSPDATTVFPSKCSSTTFASCQAITLPLSPNSFLFELVNRKRPFSRFGLILSVSSVLSVFSVFKTLIRQS